MSNIFIKTPLKLIITFGIYKIGVISAIVLFIVLSFWVKSSSSDSIISNYFSNGKEIKLKALYFSQNYSNSYDLNPYISDSYTISAISSPSNVNGSLLAVISGSNRGSSSVIEEYIVQKGDTLSSISEKFGISVETIKNVNKISSKIYEGQKLIILPVDGVIHNVKSGDTVYGLAKLYQTDVDSIISFNDLDSDGKIYIGDVLVIPYGKMPKYKFIEPQNIVKLANSYFICPIGKPCRITNPLHWYNAVDISHGKCGEPVFAAAGGKVIKAKTTSSRSKYAYGGLGNHVRILHPNGVSSTYAHLKSVLVYEGQQVSQGQIIGTVGGKPGTPGAGKSTGCHVHFSVNGAENPFAR